MRKVVALLFVMSAVCSPASVVLAIPNPDTGPGCGLGKELWKNFKNQKNILPQVMMATTNVTGFQTFAISFGTSGCSNDGVFMSEYKVTLFAELNFENLAQDMAQGQGEHLASLATLMGVPDEQHQEFFAMAQEHYGSPIREGEPSAAAVVAALYEAMGRHPVLAKLNVGR